MSLCDCEGLWVCVCEPLWLCEGELEELGVTVWLPETVALAVPDWLDVAVSLAVIDCDCELVCVWLDDAL